MSVRRFSRLGFEQLQAQDTELYELINRDYQRQMESLILVAAASLAAPSVLVCEGTPLSNVTTEGYSGHRFHAGCEVVDRVEDLAIERAKAAFGARYANVQPHSATSANEILMFRLLKPRDTILGLELNSGGHLTHGARASVSGRYFKAIGYGLDADGLIDYDQVSDLAQQHRPRLIVCGASAYSRIIDFRLFRQIADSVDALLLADMSQIAGLVAAREHPSPIDHAHFTTTSTYKQLCGPRGGLILMGRDSDSPAPDGRGTLSELVQRAVFPFFQGTPHLGMIAAKARAFASLITPEWRSLAQQIIRDARSLAHGLMERGHHVLTGGTDNHLVLIDVYRSGLTGIIAERALEACNIIVNKNRIPGDRKSAAVTSGIRFGTNTVALRGMEADDMEICADLIQAVLKSTVPLGDQEYQLPPGLAARIRAEVKHLCHRFPIPDYPIPDNHETSPINALLHQ
jgi:glycine hydroxymethyltransferase